MKGPIVKAKRHHYISIDKELDGASKEVVSWEIMNI